MVKNISLLGASGSIGRQTLEVCGWHLGKLNISAMTAGKEWRYLSEMARKWRPKLVVIRDETQYGALKKELLCLPIKVMAGEEGLIAAATWEETELVVAAISGIAGLKPLMAAIDAGKDIALANKESLVAAGEIVMPRVREQGLSLLPVDSEHSALWQCLAGEKMSGIAELVLTASGGAFRDLPIEDLRNVTVTQALAHPNWRMGAKITVDCATMVNKALEIIEAHWLFDVSYNQISALLHPESIVHSLVRFQDGCLKAQLGAADMRLPIQYALFGGARPFAPIENIDLARIGSLHFAEPESERYPAFFTMRQAGEQGGTAPAYMNGANELLVQEFLAGNIDFPQIGSILNELINKYLPTVVDDDIEKVYAADEEGRADAAAKILEVLN